MGKTLTIMRGLPGSGKSTAAPSGMVCSADHFFTDPDGYYRFDVANIGRAHAECQAKAIRGMASGYSSIVIDNTNTQRWEWMVYEAAAEAFGYEVKIIEVGGRSADDVAEYARRNIHGVPAESIQKMADRWEP